MGNTLPNVKNIIEVAMNDVQAVIEHGQKLRGEKTNDFSFNAVSVFVGEECESGMNNSESFTVDLETGLLIIEAAQAIIAARLLKLNGPG